MYGQPHPRPIEAYPQDRKVVYLTCLVYHCQSSRQDTGHHQHRNKETGQGFNNQRFHLKSKPGQKLRRY